MERERAFKYSQRKSKRVLLVDDEEDLGWIMRDIFRDAGHRLNYATTADEGMEKIKNSKNLDMAIVDLRLGSENGLTFIKKAKMINRTINFIMISAFGTPDSKTKARRLGVRHFLDKPIKVERLLNIVNREGVRR